MEEEKRKKNDKKEIKNHGGNGRTVLLVDDDEYLINMYVLKFKNAGFNVIFEKSARDALQKIKDGLKADIVLLDFIMPDMHGLDFLEEIRKADLLPKVKFVALTNQNQREDIERAKKLGIVKYIVKASTIPSEIVNEVKNILADK